MLFRLGPNKAFLVPDSCRATERNGISIITDIRDNRWRHWKQFERRLFQLFSDNLAGVLHVLILQDKHNTRTLSLNIKLICTWCEIVYNRSCQRQRLAFLSVSRTNKFYIFRQCKYIVYIYEVFFLFFTLHLEKHKLLMLMDIWCLEMTCFVFYWVIILRSCLGFEMHYT